MSDLATPQAQRLRRPSWRDSRVLVGLVLLLVSTAVGGWLFAQADDTTTVYAASRPLVAGQPLTPADVTPVKVQVGSDVAPLLDGSTPPADSFILRPVGAGELIPRAIVGDASQVKTRILTVQVDTSSISLLSRGSIVDVYVNRPTGSAAAGGRPELAGPELLLQSVSVAEVPEARAVLGGVISQRPVLLVVPTERVQDFVADIDLGARITLVPAPGSGQDSPQ